MQDFALEASKLENNKEEIFLSPSFLVCNSVSAYAASREQSQVTSHSNTLKSNRENLCPEAAHSFPKSSGHAGVVLLLKSFSL